MLRWQGTFDEEGDTAFQAWIVQAFTLLIPYLYIATDLEALHIGIFINAIMQIYQRWLVSFH